MLRKNRWLSFAALMASVGLGQTVKEITDPRVNSPQEQLRKKIFKNLDKPACASIPQKLRVSVDKNVSLFIENIIESIKNKNAAKLQPMFHKRTNVSLVAIKSTFRKLESVFQSPFDITTYRLFALNTVDGSATGLHCDDSRLTVFPSFGYPLQFGLWLQVMGKKELGRIYISLVPTDQRWNIGAFHLQQWTHESRDFATWAEEARKNALMGYRHAAYVKYDIAAKLLNGGGFIDVAMQNDLYKKRDSILSKEVWQRDIKGMLSDWQIAYVGTLLVRGGAGILLRIRVPKEISVNQIKRDCQAIAKQLKKTDWST